MLALPPTDTVESSFTVSSWPSGHWAGAEASAMGRSRSKVAPHARQRYSYRGTRAAYATSLTPAGARAGQIGTPGAVAGAAQPRVAGTDDALARLSGLSP